MALIEFTERGLFCQQGDFYIDPWQPVNKAVITHAHSDHARPGSKDYLCHHFTKPLLQLRLGDNNYQSVDWDEKITMNGVNISLYPAGHIIGSSQVRIEYKGEIWVVSGDYKLQDDGLSGAFQPVRCHTFITECTFGLPIYKWRSQATIFTDIKEWIINNNQQGKTSILIAYSLGKAQRILSPLAETGLPIFAHGAVYNIHKTLVNNGWKLPPVTWVQPDTSKDILKGNIVIAPNGAGNSPWMKKFYPLAIGVCSGWMQLRGHTRRSNADIGFALSDHADWEGLLQGVKATGAEKVYATHGFQSAFSRYLQEKGIESGEIRTQYGNDEEEVKASLENILAS